jgi:hypothetical protein
MITFLMKDSDEHSEVKFLYSMSFQKLLAHSEDIDEQNNL